MDVAYTTIVGDRPEDMEDVVAVHGGRGAGSDLDQRGVGTYRGRPDRRGRREEFQGREMVLDEALEGRIAEILRPLAKRWPNLDMEAISGEQSQAGGDSGGGDDLGAGGDRPGPRRATAASPRASRRSSCCRGRRGSCSRCGARRSQTDALRRRSTGRPSTGRRCCGCIGIPESEIAETLRVAEREGVELGRLEITTCLKRGEVEVVTRYEPARAGGLRRVRGGRTRAARGHAVLRRRQHGRRSGRRAAARRRIEHGRSPPPSPAQVGCWRPG